MPYQYTQSCQSSNTIPRNPRPPAPLALHLADLAYYGGCESDVDPADYLRPLKGVRVG